MLSTIWLTIIVFIICLVFLMALAIGNHFYKKKHKAKADFHEKLLENKILENNSLFLKKQTYELFNNLQNDLKLAKRNELKVSIINKTYHQRLLTIINSAQYKQITSDESNKFYKQAILLQTFLKITPFSWYIKHQKLIEQYYV